MLVGYKNVPPRRFNRVFPILAPCECHTEDGNTLYDVLIFANDKTSLVSSVKVTCSVCGSSATFDMRSYKKSLKDVALLSARKIK